jgi:hypothetical protein
MASCNHPNIIYEYVIIMDNEIVTCRVVRPIRYFSTKIEKQIRTIAGTIHSIPYPNKEALVSKPGRK